MKINPGILVPVLINIFKVDRNSAPAEHKNQLPATSGLTL